MSVLFRTESSGLDWRYKVLGPAPVQSSIVKWNSTRHNGEAFIELAMDQQRCIQQREIARKLTCSNGKRSARSGSEQLFVITVDEDYRGPLKVWVETRWYMRESEEKTRNCRILKISYSALWGSWNLPRSNQTPRIKLPRSRRHR